MMDILLTTTDAEVLFLQTNSTLFHGETIKVHNNFSSGVTYVLSVSQISPLRIKREWYSLDKEYIRRLANEMAQQVGDRFYFNPVNLKLVK